MYDKKNIFAKIIEKNLPASIVFEDDKIMAFKDMYPVAPVHILVVPKGEFIDYSNFIQQASKEDVANFFTKLYEIAVSACGNNFRICTNNGPSSGQTIFHFHAHIIGGKELGAMC